MLLASLAKSDYSMNEANDSKGQARLTWVGGNGAAIKGSGIHTSLASQTYFCKRLGPD